MSCPTATKSSTSDHKAQRDTRAAILVDGLESRACLSTILAYTCSLEDAKILAKRLCKKGSDFIEKDEGYLESLCVPRDKIKKDSSDEGMSPLQRCINKQAAQKIH